MAWTKDMYRKVTATLWGAVSLAVGLSIGYYFDMSEKKIIFVVVVVVGLYLIALLRWSKKNEESEGPEDANDFNSANKQEEQPEPTATVIEDEKKITNDESREWLDEFLIKQQKD